MNDLTILVNFRSNEDTKLGTSCSRDSDLCQAIQQVKNNVICMVSAKLQNISELTEPEPDDFEAKMEV